MINEHHIFVFVCLFVFVPIVIAREAKSRPRLPSVATSSIPRGLQYATDLPLDCFVASLLAMTIGLRTKIIVKLPYP